MRIGGRAEKKRKPINKVIIHENVNTSRKSGGRLTNDTIFFAHTDIGNGGRQGQDIEK